MGDEKLKPPGKLYLTTIAFIDRFVPPPLVPLWNHPVGPKTVFFWMPFVKWGLVLAAVGDLTQPASIISIPQTASVGCTGLLWARFAHQIKPKNYSLMTVNMLVFVSNSYLCIRGIRYKYFNSSKEI